MSEVDKAREFILCAECMKIPFTEYVSGDDEAKRQMLEIVTRLAHGVRPR
jgi:hypothetical protein